MSTDARAPAVVKSVGRVVEVFELFRSTRAPLNGSEIARRLGYPKSSTNALLKSLVALGYLSFDAHTLSYHPTLRLTQLGDWVPAALLGSGETLNLLQELHDATNETVTLSMQNGLSIQFLRIIQGTFPISLRVVEGSMAPLLTTGVGTVLLSTRSDEEVLDLVRKANARTRRRRERVDADALLGAVETVRRTGYVTAYGKLIPDAGAIAMPMRGATRGWPLAVAVAGLEDRIRRNERAILRTMRTTLARHVPAGRR